MKILMLVNWKVQYCDKKPLDKQPPDYCVYGEDYWFYRYFENKPNVDVVDIASFSWLENFEKNKIRFYIWQAFRAIPRLKEYDLIVSHGMQSGIVVALWRRLFKTQVKHIVFDIGSFASASESGFALKLMQFASKSIDGIIYHTSSQIEYYKSFFPWIVDKSQFIRFGTDLDFFTIPTVAHGENNTEKYIVCVGYAKRDWDTVINAYKKISSSTDYKLKLVGKVDPKYKGLKGVEQIPFVPVNELIHIIDLSQFCVLPLDYLNYSFGQMTLMQQMALGKCVIAANVPSLIDYFVDGYTAIGYKSGDVFDLSDKIMKLIYNPQQAESIGKNAREYLIENINEAIMSKQIELFLKKYC